jgi:histidinol dehydrogenase
MLSSKELSNLDVIKKINSRLDPENLSHIEKTVSEIVNKVKNTGNAAIKEFSEKFDKYTLKDEELKGISVKGAYKLLDAELKQSLEVAKERIERFHIEEYRSSNFAQGWGFTGNLGERLGVRYTSLDSVAVYIPGGKAPLFSTVLMTVIPAKVAGVKRIVLFSPPPIHPSIQGLADLLDIDEIYPIGGAQAIAAAAYGTETIKPVDKVVGPGNIFVSLAKKNVFGTIGIDGIFGPSELTIVADNSANPKEIAADFLSQLEHGSGLESALLICTDQKLLADSIQEIEAQIDSLKAHKTDEQIAVIRSSYKNYSACIFSDNPDEISALINFYAPEHLELQVVDSLASILIPSVKHAGAIFIGANACESLGDYLAGPSHCLPTGRGARYASGLHSADFMKKSSLIDFRGVSKDCNGFKELAKHTARLARAENLEAHAQAIINRVSQL